MDKYKRKFLSQPMAYIATLSRKGSRSLSASWFLRYLGTNVPILGGSEIVTFLTISGVQILKKTRISTPK